MSKALSRRNFLRSAPVSVAAGAQAAKRIAQQAAQHAIVSNQAASYASIGGIVDGGVPVGRDSWRLFQAHVFKLFKSGNVPKEKLRGIVRRAKFDSAIVDADLEAMVSLSQTTKQRLQTERNIKKYIQEFIESNEEQEWSQSLYEKFRDEAF